MTRAEISVQRSRAVLVIEDVDHKFDEVRAVLEEVLGQDVSFERARTVVEAQDAVLYQKWDLVVVDISMDITSANESRTREAYANLGGMDIIEQMYLMERHAPTLIVTGFDYFMRSDRDSSAREAQTFAEINRQAEKWLGKNLLGCIRYGVTGWQRKLADSLAGHSQ